MRIFKDSFWNILGIGIPICIAIPTMGYLARALGVEKFGIFTIIFAIVGYASIFDLGLNRAVVRAIAINETSKACAMSVMGTATVFVTLVSLCASMAIYFSAEWLTGVLSISKEIREEAIVALKWLCLAVPPLLVSTVWLSYLEGRHRFYELNKLKVVSGLALSICPLLAVLYDNSLISAVAGIVAGRFFTMAVAYKYGLPDINKTSLYSFNTDTFKTLITFGGWVTVSNIISPIMVYFDRLYISSLIGAKSVAFYSAPAEAIAKLLLIPGSIVKVLFPKLSAGHSDAESQARLGSWLLLIVTIGMAGFVGVFSEEIILLWLGANYLGESVVVLRILLIGFIFNSMAQMPFARIQALGNSKSTALIHIAEVAPYLALLYYMMVNYSLIGAAWAWSIRAMVDCLVLELVSRRLRKQKTNLLCSKQYQRIDSRA